MPDLTSTFTFTTILWYFSQRLTVAFPKFTLYHLPDAASVFFLVRRVSVPYGRSRTGSVFYFFSCSYLPFAFSFGLRDLRHVLGNCCSALFFLNALVHYRVGLSFLPTGVVCSSKSARAPVYFIWSFRLFSKLRTRHIHIIYIALDRLRPFTIKRRLPHRTHFLK